MLAKSDGEKTPPSEISFHTRISKSRIIPNFPKYIFPLERVSNPLLPANKQWIEDPRLASQPSPQRLIDGASPPLKPHPGIRDDTLKDTKVT